MIKYKHLLCPIDFSDVSNHAFKVATDLAATFKADLHVIHVFQMPASTIPEGAIPLQTLPNYLELIG